MLRARAHATARRKAKPKPRAKPAAMTALMTVKTKGEFQYPVAATAMTVMASSPRRASRLHASSS